MNEDCRKRGLQHDFQHKDEALTETVAKPEHPAPDP
jgi:hypothetical protein